MCTLLELEIKKQKRHYYVDFVFRNKTKNFTEPKPQKYLTNNEPLVLTLK